MSKDGENEKKTYKDFYIMWLVFAVVFLLFALALAVWGPNQIQGFGAIMSVVMFVCVLGLSFAVATTEWEPKPDPKPDDPPAKSMPIGVIIGLVITAALLVWFFVALFSRRPSYSYGRF